MPAAAHAGLLLPDLAAVSIAGLMAVGKPAVSSQVSDPVVSLNRSGLRVTCSELLRAQSSSTCSRSAPQPGSLGDCSLEGSCEADSEASFHLSSPTCLTANPGVCCRYGQQATCQEQPMQG